MLLAVFLFTIQCSKRFYETHFVSVFSKNSRMDLSHYVLGHIHYFGVFLAILCEAPMFTNNNDGRYLKTLFVFKLYSLLFQKLRLVLMI